MLEHICTNVDIPILRKDFIQTEEQIRETAASGASAVLLIVAMLTEIQLGRLYDATVKYGLTALVETHNPEQIKTANKIQSELIGINNRDILSLEKDNGEVSLTEQLIKAVQGTPYIVSESSIQNSNDVLRARNAGASAVLVGTALLKAEDIAEKYTELSIPLTEAHAR